MQADLSGLLVAVVGGDDRELVLIPELIKLGAQVKVTGFPPRSELALAQITAGVDEAINGVDAIILPMPGTDNYGNVRAIYATGKLVFNEAVIRKIPRGVPVFIGVAKPYLRELAARRGIRLVEIADLDDLAIMNSIPSAEGAIQIAMEELPITIHGSSSYILGFGRVAATLARMLQGLGSKVTVVARNSAQLARAEEMGCRVLSFDHLIAGIGEAQVIYNTVPAMVLTAEVLAAVDRQCLIVDLANQPGGTDFPAAEKLGIKALLAPGLPGKVAPRTAGMILAKVIPPLILQEKAAVHNPPC